MRKNLSEVEQDAKEAFEKRRELAKLLVEKITVDRDEDGRAKVHIAYRFGPLLEESDRFLVGVRNSRFLRLDQGPHDGGVSDRPGPGIS